MIKVQLSVHHVSTIVPTDDGICEMGLLFTNWWWYLFDYCIMLNTPISSTPIIIFFNSLVEIYVQKDYEHCEKKKFCFEYYPQPLLETIRNDITKEIELQKEQIKFFWY